MRSEDFLTPLFMEPNLEMKSPVVTVVLPTYNRAGFLKESIQSVLSQTFTDFELIVVDDGSIDHTKEVAQGFPQIRYILCQENKGVSAARNRGIGLARGRYICFLDSDDLWVKNKLETQIAWMESQTDCQVCYTDEIWIRRGVRVNPMNKHRKVTGDIFTHCLPLCVVSPSSVLMRASLFSEIGVFDEALAVCEDYDLWLRISLKYPVHLIDEKLLIKRGGHEDQLSSKYWGMDRFRVAALLKLLREPSLGDEQRVQVIEMMQTKCGILIQGFAKRGKRKEVEYYQSLVKLYSGGENQDAMPEPGSFNALQIPGLE